MPLATLRRPLASAHSRVARAVARPDKRVLILRAAIREFAKRGFFGTQVADVARSAGVAAGTVYLYFRNKDDLLVSIFEQVMAETISEGRALLDRLTEPIDRLRALARLHLERLGRDRDLAIVFQVELRQSTKFMERCSTSLLRDYLGLIRDTIAQGQARGGFRADVSPTIAAKMLFGALDEMATNWVLSKRRQPLEPLAETVVDLFVRGVGAADLPEPGAVR